MPETITRGDGTPYLRRWRLLERPWGGVYLHRFLAPDDACLHDHPWSYLSIILWGGYVEQTPVAEGATLDLWRRAGSIAWHPADWTHRIAVILPRTWTLIVRGRRGRIWGFHGRRGWVPWTVYDHRRDG